MALLSLSIWCLSEWGKHSEEEPICLPPLADQIAFIMKSKRFVHTKYAPGLGQHRNSLFKDYCTIARFQIFEHQLRTPTQYPWITVASIHWWEGQEKHPIPEAFLLFWRKNTGLLLLVLPGVVNGGFPCFNLEMFNSEIASLLGDCARHFTLHFIPISSVMKNFALLCPIFIGHF